VLDAGGRTPVKGARVSARPLAGAVFLNLDEIGVADGRQGGTFEAATGPDGAFAIAGLPAGNYTLAAVTQDGLRGRAFAAAAPEGAFAAILVSEERTTGSDEADLVVRVEDGDGQPVAGAEVSAPIPCKEQGFVPGAGGFTALRRSAVTDAFGEARLSPPPRPGALLLARTADGRAAQKPLHSDQDLSWVSDGDRFVRILRLSLLRAGAIQGTLAGGPGVRIHAWGVTDFERGRAAGRVDHTVTANEAGEFLFEGLAPGLYWMTVEAPPGQELELPRVEDPKPWSSTDLSCPHYLPKSVKVRPGEVSEVALQLVPSAAVEGLVVSGADRSPVPGARVRAWLDPDWCRRAPGEWRLDHEPDLAALYPMFARQVVTGPDGTYRLDNLVPGERWRIEVGARGLSFDVRESVALGGGETLSLTHELVAAGILQGTAWGEAHIGIRAAGDEDLALSFTTPNDAAVPFTIPGLVPGAYEVVAWLEGEPFVLDTVEVQAGAVTWVDLRRALPIGRLIIGHNSAAGHRQAFRSWK
jgi:hypothetical protein